MDTHYPSNVKAGLAEKQVIVLLIPDEKYTSKLLYVTKELVELGDQLLYISLNRPYNTLVESFPQAGIDLNKVHFIDAITQTAQKVDTSDPHVNYVSSPGSLTELSLEISKLVESQKFSYLLFDSLSTLLVYEEELVVTKFVHSLMSKLRVINCKGVFTCLKRDMDSVLLKDLNMFADVILDASAWGGA